MTVSFSKSRIVEALKQKLENDTFARAAWLGGSKATGYEDDLSDTDLVVVSEYPEKIFESIEEVLRSIADIEHIWKVEESPWKDFSQKFYILKGAPETYYLDIGVFQSLKSADYEEHFNVDRHGSPVILFDKSGILKEASARPRLESQKKIQWDQWLARFEIVYRTFLKESLRNKFIDSFTFYQRMVMMWVQLVRVHETPQKHDFGMRYLYRDLSAEGAAYIEDLFKVQNIAEMQMKAAQLRENVKRYTEEVR